MWDAPSWIGTAISKKIDERIAEANRTSNEAIAQQNRTSNEYIAELEAASREQVASINQETSMYAADLSYASGVASRELERDLTAKKIASNESIVADQLASNELIAFTRLTTEKDIAKLQRELTSTENALQRSWQSAENVLNRENAVDVAEINAAANVSGSVIRTVPYVITPIINGANNDKFNNNNSNFTFKSTPVVATGLSETKSAKQKADDLFPDLEPTFKRSILPTIGAALVSAAAGILSFVPFI